MTRVEKVREVLNLMKSLDVSSTDLETFSLVESFDYALVDVDATFEAVTDFAGSLWENDESLFAWSVNRDRLYDTLVEKGLYVSEEDED